MQRRPGSGSRFTAVFRSTALRDRVTGKREKRLEQATAQQSRSYHTHTHTHIAQPRNNPAASRLSRMARDKICLSHRSRGLLLVFCPEVIGFADRLVGRVTQRRGRESCWVAVRRRLPTPSSPPNSLTRPPLILTHSTRSHNSLSLRQERGRRGRGGCLLVGPFPPVPISF